jgi:hypothetical protein
VTLDSSQDLPKELECGVSRGAEDEQEPGLTLELWRFCRASHKLTVNEVECQSCQFNSSSFESTRSVSFDPDRRLRLMLSRPTCSWHRSFSDYKVLRHELAVLHAQLNKSGTTIVAYTATTEQSGSMMFIRVLPLQAVGPRRLHCDWAGPFSVLSLAPGPEWRTNGVASSLSTSRPRTLAPLRLA